MFRPLEEGRGNRGNLKGVEVTYKININQSIVTLVTLVTSIFSRACEGGEYRYISSPLLELDLLCKNEVTEVTEVTWPSTDAVFSNKFLKSRGNLEVTLGGARGNLSGQEAYS